MKPSIESECCDTVNELIHRQSSLNPLLKAPRKITRDSIRATVASSNLPKDSNRVKLRKARKYVHVHLNLEKLIIVSAFNSLEYLELYSIMISYYS